MILGVPLFLETPIYCYLGVLNDIKTTLKWYHDIYVLKPGSL